MEISLPAVFQDLEPRILVCADASGHVLEYLPPDPPFDAYTLAVLAAANVAAVQEMKLLSDINAQNDVDVLITSTDRGAIVVVQAQNGVLFIAVTEPTTKIGIAKLMLMRLARAYTETELAAQEKVSEQIRATLFDRLKEGKAFTLPPFSPEGIDKNPPPTSRT